MKVLSESSNHTAEPAKKAALELFDYCRSHNWAGYDPYDGLTSPLFERLPFVQNKPARLVFIQLMKRSVINFRGLMRIAPDQNPKGLAVFSSALIKLLNLGLIRDAEIIHSLVNQLIQKKTPNQDHSGWGYNFDWQTRTVFVPKHTPNIICTSFAGNALLDAYEKFGNALYLENARSAGQFIMKGFHISEKSNGICFSYTPLDRAKVHNANLLGASFLARLYGISGEKELLDHAYKAARYSASMQSSTGAWAYGENQTQKWVDNFHTGYNLMALYDFARYTGIKEFDKHIEKGFVFYKQNFFHDGCQAKYYNNKLYPIDVHAIAQSIITLIRLKDFGRDNKALAHSVCKWALDNMRDKAGFFYYQKKKLYMNKISYMRWSQAWMLLALATLLEESGEPQRNFPKKNKIKLQPSVSRNLTRMQL